MDTGRTVRFEPQCALIPEVAYSALPRLETRTYAVPLPIHWGSRATTNVRSSNATDTIHEMDASKASPEDSPRRLVVRVPRYANKLS